MDLRLKNNSSLILTTLPSGIADACETILVKNCQGVNAINLLRACSNLTNVYCSVGNVSGNISEVQHYATLHGYNANEEVDNTVPATIIGTFTVTGWHTTAQLQAIQNTITGLTIAEDSAYNLDTLINNDALAVQTLDSTKANYNPAAAIILQQNNVGTVIDAPIVSGGGTYFLKKTDAALITTINDWFTNVVSVVDANAIVTSDNTETYDFETFDELGYFTGITNWTLGTAAGGGTFRNCTSLEKFTIPTSLGNRQYIFNGCSALKEIKFLVPHTVGAYRYYGCNLLTKVYFNSLDDFLDSDFGEYAINTISYWPFDRIGEGHIYINNTEITNLVIPSERTTINRGICKLLQSLTSVTIPSSVTTIKEHAFCGCIGLTGIFDLKYVTTIENGAFKDCRNISRIEVYTDIDVGDQFNNCGDLVNGTVIIHGNYSSSTPGNRIKTGTAIIHGTVTKNTTVDIIIAKVTRIHGNAQIKNGNFTNSTEYDRFISFGGDVTSSDASPIQMVAGANRHNVILHFAKNSLISLTPSQTGITSNSSTTAKLTNIYVGDGSSKSADETVFALYNSDSNWSAYCGSGTPGVGKVDLWWNYNGEYRTYQVQENLTDCTNSNTVTWPYITRGESYQTTIVPDEGMTLGTVTVEMYEAVDNGTTPNTPTDITNDVYNSSTGEINISSVTGNIIITATAS